MITETISSNTLYWITRCDAISHILTATTVVFSSFSILIIFGLLSLAAELGSEDNIKSQHSFIKILKITIPIVIISGLANAALPTTREMCAIIVIPKIANNEDVQGLGEDFIKTARDWIKELAPKSK